MTPLQTQYLFEARPIIKAIIVEYANNPDNTAVAFAIRKSFPWSVSNLVAVKVWEAEVVKLRLHFYKYRNFKTYGEAKKETGTE